MTSFPTRKSHHDSNAANGRYYDLIERDPINVVSGRCILTVYEPRWHGFAKWTLDRRWPAPFGEMVEALHSGFVRRETHGVRSRDFFPVQWISRSTAKKLAREVAS